MTTGHQAVTGSSPRASLWTYVARANWQIIALLAMFFVLAFAFDYLSDGIFLTPRNISFLLRQSAVLGIVAVGVAILIIMSEIDLSIGSAVYLVGVVAATCETAYGLGLGPTFVLAIAFGLVLGTWQGFWVAVVGVPSFIVTLTGLLAFRGLGLYWTDARTLAPLLDEHVNLSESYVEPVVAWWAAGIAITILAVVMLRRAFRKGGRQEGRSLPGTIATILSVVLMTAVTLLTLQGYHGVPTAILWTLAVVGILWFVMARTVFGRNAYMIGANRAAAALAGVNVRRNVFFGFLLMGALYGIGGLLFTARLNASTAGDATFLELDAIAASVIGGVALSGGKGWIPAVLGGALLLSTIDNGMSVIGVSSFLQEIVKGAILLFAVAVDVRFRGRRL